MILYGKEQVQPWNLEFSSNLYWGLKQSDVGERYIQTVGTTKRKTKRVHGLISPSWVIVSSMRMKSSVIMHTLTSVCCRYSESLGSLWQLNVKLNRSFFYDLLEFLEISLVYTAFVSDTSVNVQLYLFLPGIFYIILAQTHTAPRNLWAECRFFLHCNKTIRAKCFKISQSL